MNLQDFNGIVETVVRKYSPKIHSHETDDLRQEALLKLFQVWTKITEIEDPDHRIKYVHRVLINRMKDIRGKGWRTVPISDGEDIPDTPIEATQENTAYHIQVQDSILELSQFYRGKRRRFLESLIGPATIFQEMPDYQNPDVMVYRARTYARNQGRNFGLQSDHIDELFDSIKRSLVENKKPTTSVEEDMKVSKGQEVKDIDFISFKAKRILEEKYKGEDLEIKPSSNGPGYEFSNKEDNFEFYLQGEEYVFTSGGTTNKYSSRKDVVSCLENIFN